MASDSRFRSGLISGKQWARLSKAKGGRKQHGRMAEFDQKSKDEGDTKVTAVSTTKRGHIDGPDQAKAVKSAGSRGSTRHFGGGAIKARTLAKQQPMRTNPSGPPYGGGNSRP